MRLAVRCAMVVGLTSLAPGCAHTQAKVATEAPPPAPVAAAPAAAPAPKDDASRDFADLMKRATLHFEFNADALSPESQERLNKVAEVLKSHAGITAKVSGNCDERGTDEYNLALGQRRAGVAKRYLVQLGVDPKRIDTVTFGAEKPAEPGHDEAAWAANRRDEIDLKGAP